MRRRLLELLAVGVVLVAALPALTGCGRLSALPPAEQSPTATPAATASVAPTASVPATAGVATGTPGAKGGKPLSAGDAKALDAELGAIQSELDRLSVPSDSDFDGISSGLK